MFASRTLDDCKPLHLAVAGGFRDAGASLHAVALGREHAFAHGTLAVRATRRVSWFTFSSLASENCTNLPDLTLCLRHCHWRNRRWQFLAWFN